MVIWGLFLGPLSFDIFIGHLKKTPRAQPILFAIIHVGFQQVFIQCHFIGFELKTNLPLHFEPMKILNFDGHNPSILV